MDEAQAGVVGKPLIDQVDVVVVGADPAQAFRSRADHLEHSLEMRVGQRHLDELARLRVVVNRQDPDDTKVWKPRGWPPVRRIGFPARGTDTCIN